MTSRMMSTMAFIACRRHLGGRQNAIAVPEPEINDEVVSGMEYNETGKWREGFDLAGWAKEIREVRRKERVFFVSSSSSPRIGL